MFEHLNEVLTHYEELMAGLSDLSLIHISAFTRSKIIYGFI